MIWKTLRLAVHGPNLYRWRGVTAAGWPREVEHFNRDPRARAVLGRWSPCPNVNIARAIVRKM